MQEFLNYIGGKWTKSNAGKTFQVKNPSKPSQVLGSFQLSGREDVQEAMRAARDGFKQWAGTPAPQRGKILYRAARLLDEQVENLSRVLTMEEGKTLKESEGEVRRAVDIFYYYAGMAPNLDGKTVPSAHQRTFLYTKREPIGVVGVLTPWNFPIAIPAWKIAPALVSGDCVVFKPASLTPLIAHSMVEALDKAGLPAGALNMVTGPGGEVGEEIISSPELDAISFTGSTDVGRRINKLIAAGKRFVRVQLELGGKNPAVVLPDARLEEVVPLIKSSAFGLTGQACTATSRLIVHESIKEKLVKRIAEEAEKLKVGDGLQPGIEMGPAVSEDQLQNDLEYIELGAREGAKILVGGKDQGKGAQSEGFFLRPTIFDDVHPDMKIAKEEIFGPVLSVMTVRNVDEAVELANATDYGLTAGIYTTNLSNALDFADKVEAGVIKVNKSTVGLEYQMPYGGFKQSSAETFKEQGHEAIDFYTRIKAVYVGY
jgi:aldehyde dehydrogenase (NAD+)